MVNNAIHTSVRQGSCLLFCLFGVFQFNAIGLHAQAFSLRSPVQVELRKASALGEARAAGEVRPARVIREAAKLREFREFVDPCLGLHWQLFVDPAHPASPGRLVPIGDPGVRPPTGTLPGESETAADRLPHSALRQLAIRAGEPVTVEQDTPVLRARFQAVALESAAVGEKLRVRLNPGRNAQISATVLTVIAAAKGRVRW